MIKILLVDDSPTNTEILKTLLESESDISVIACARDGSAAIQMVEKFKPDLITMDIHMPNMNGYQAIEVIMETYPTPIVVISSIVTDNHSDDVFRALEAGALAVLPKLNDIQSPQAKLKIRDMIDTIRSMSQINVIKRRRLSTASLHPEANRGDYHIVVMGASVGGPQALREILSRLPSNFPLPMMIVQHMTSGFIEGFTKWLDANLDLKVKCAEHGEVLQPGVVYFAPDHFHSELNKFNHAYKVSLVRGNPVAGFCPSITTLMNSVARNCDKDAIGILLTGMGSDGAEGLLSLKHKGAHTIIQDPTSCIVFGMGNIAQTMGAVEKVVELDKIAEYLIMLTNKNKK